MKIKAKSVGLDIDGVLCNFAQGFIDAAYDLGHGHEVPKHYTHIDHWDICPNFSTIMKKFWKDEDFWSNLKPLRNPDLPFTPRCYITSRVIPNSVTKNWLAKHGFPTVPVITVSNPEHKLAYIKMLGLDLFVDDLHSTVRQVINAGHNAVLYKAPYQVGHPEECAGLPTISELEEIECIG